jgi:hypothetical protein
MPISKRYINTSLLPDDILSYTDTDFYNVAKQIVGASATELLEIQSVRSPPRSKRTGRIRPEFNGNHRIRDAVFRTGSHRNFPLTFLPYPPGNDGKSCRKKSGNFPPGYVSSELAVYDRFPTPFPVLFPLIPLLENDTHIYVSHIWRSSELRIGILSYLSS